MGWREIEERLAQPIFDSLGNVREADPQECIGLEPSAVWEPSGVEERLLDAFMGRPNDAMARMRVRLR
jgi:hypothetical protein